MKPLGLFLLAILSIPGVPAAGSGTARDTDRKEIEALFTLHEQGINENRLDVLRDRVTNDFSIVLWTGEAFPTFDSFEHHWTHVQETLHHDGARYRLTIIPERFIVGDGWAVVHGHSENVWTGPDGREHRVRPRSTAFLRKIEGTWKFVRLHSSIEPGPLPPSDFGRLWIGVLLGIGIGAVAAWGILRRRG